MTLERLKKKLSNLPVLPLQFRRSYLHFTSNGANREKPILHVNSANNSYSSNFNLSIKRGHLCSALLWNTHIFVFYLLCESSINVLNFILPSEETMLLNLKSRIRVYDLLNYNWYFARKTLSNLKSRIFVNDLLNLSLSFKRAKLLN